MLSLSVCVLLCCIVLPQNIKCVNQDEKITEVAEAFKLYGKDELDAWKNNRKNAINNYNYPNYGNNKVKKRLLDNVTGVRMYAVAGILSMGEVKNMPVNGLVNYLLLEDCKRLMFLNNVIAEPPRKFEKEYYHQEKQLVDNYFLQMKKCYEQKYPDNRPNDKGVIILYSWYIPCFKPTKKQKYSCSTELAKYVKDRNKHDTDKYEHFYVVYSQNFRCENKKEWQCFGTNEGQSTKTMLESGIKLGRLNEENNIKIKWIKLGEVLQQYLYDCLIIYSKRNNQPTFGCTDSRIVAYAVNFAMSRCVDQMYGRRPPELSENDKYNDNGLQTCLIDKWITPYLLNYQTFDHFCLHDYATSCVKQAILYAGSTGKSDIDLSKPSWDSKAPTYGNKGVVATGIKEFKQSRGLRCNHPYHMNSPETLCTSDKATTPEPSDSVT